MTGVALVTGGSRGIGRAVALEAARRGYDVLVGCGRDRQRAQEVASAVGELGGRSRVCVADLCTRRGASKRRQRQRGNWDRSACWSTTPG